MHEDQLKQIPGHYSSRVNGSTTDINYYSSQERLDRFGNKIQEKLPGLKTNHKITFKDEIFKE